LIIIAVMAIVVLAIGGLVTAIVIKQRKPKGKKTRARLEQALDVVDEASHERTGGQQVSGKPTVPAEGGGHTSTDKPSSEAQGAVGDDGFEWLEWPEQSERWWFRNDSGYWDEWLE
jgi:hypothetical protein